MYVAGYRDVAYWERLKSLKIQSLQRRRERYVIIHTWKILNNLTNNDIGLSFTDTENSSRITGTSWEGPSRMGLVRILELGHFMLHLVMTHFKHFIKSNYFCSPSTIG